MKLKKSIASVLVLCCLVSIFPGAFAVEASSPENQIMDVTYETITKEAYIQLEAQTAGISYEEAEQIHNQKSLDILHEYGVPNAPQSRDIEIIDSEYMGNGVYNEYLMVTGIHTKWFGWSIKVTVPAWRVRHHYGQSFSEVLSDEATAHPYGTGLWQWVDDSGSVNTIISSDKTSLIFSVWGNMGFPIALEGSANINIGLSGFVEGSGNLGAGVELIYRQDVSFTYTETLPNSGG